MGVLVSERELTMNLRHVAGFLLGGVLFLAGCVDAAKTSADAAIKAGDEAFNAVKGDAMKYVPDQAKPISDSLDAAKAAFAKEDYAGALAAAKDVAANAKDLGPAAMKAKDELTAGWGNLSAGMPKMVADTEARAKALTKAHKLPEGAAEKLDAVQKGWAEASDAFKAGNLADAMSKGNAVKGQLMELASSLGVKTAAVAK